MKSFKLNRLLMLLVAFLILSINQVWGAGRLEINTTNSGVNGSYQTTTCTVDGIMFNFTDWMKSTNIQAKKSTTYSFYNSDPIPGDITQVVVCQTGTFRDVTIHGSNFYDEEEATEAGETYFEEEISAPTTDARMVFSFAEKNTDTSI